MELDHLSVSTVNALLECTEKIVLKQKYRTPGIAMFVGSVLHETLENVVLLRKKHGADFEIDQEVINAIFSAAYDNNCLDFSKDIQYLFKEGEEPFFMKPQSYKSRVREILNPVLNPGKLLNITPNKGIDINPEEGFNEDFYGYKWVGYIDANYIPKDPEAPVVVYDYKVVTSSRSFSNWKKVTSTFQGWVYQQINRKHFTDREVKVVFIIIYLPYKKLPGLLLGDNEIPEVEAELLFVPMNFTKEEELMYETRPKTAKAMLENDVVIIGQSKYGCNYCGYKNVCKYYNKKEK